jgi:hypothetical protein
MPRWLGLWTRLCPTSGGCNVGASMVPRPLLAIPPGRSSCSTAPALPPEDHRILWQLELHAFDHRCAPNLDLEATVLMHSDCRGSCLPQFHSFWCSFCRWWQAKLLRPQWSDILGTYHGHWFAPGQLRPNLEKAAGLLHGCCHSTGHCHAQAAALSLPQLPPLTRLGADREDAVFELASSHLFNLR